jgi:putative transposase
MKEEGQEISIKKLCSWFKIPRSSFYYKPQVCAMRKPRALDQELVGAIRELIDEHSTYGVRMITAVLRKKMNKPLNRKKVHRILKFNNWQIYKKKGGFRKRVEHSRSQANNPNERWAIDATSIFCGEDGWCPFTAVIDCCDRHIVGWRLSQSGVSKNAAMALEEALLSRKSECCLSDLTLRSDNGLIFGSKAFVAVAKACGVTQEYITPYTPEQNGLIERFFRTLKEDCVWQHNFKNRDEAFRVISDWLDVYHTERPHSALGYKTPAEYKQQLKAA